MRVSNVGHPERWPPRRACRRGVTYVYFLSTAMLVMLIGLSAVTLVRVRLRAAERQNASAAARLYARSAIEHGLLTIYADAGWRDGTTNDAWQPTRPIGNGSFTWKLMDEAHVDLKTDGNAPVRLHGRGVCGESVWTYSVLVQPPLETVPSNVLVNGDLETEAVAPWVQSGSCFLGVDTSTSRGGKACLLVSGRVAGSGASQALAGLASGTTWRSSVWVKMNGPSGDEVRSGIWVQSDAGWEYFESARRQVGGSWTQLGGTVTPTWSGTKLQALWVVGTDSSLEFLVDDASLVPAPATIGPLSGTWRREVQ